MKPGLLMLAAVSLLLFSCKKDFQSSESKAFASGSITAATKTLDLSNGQLKIAVVSDIHYAAPGLFINGGAAGEAYQGYLMADPKLLEYSDPIFRDVIDNLKMERPDVVLVTGDLTKDGEKLSHEGVSVLLRDLLPAKIFVIPGNHDINNPEARLYNGNSAVETPSITVNEFKGYYKDFGYDPSDASIERDPNSLSYMAKPYTNLWILGIDANKYEQNDDIAIVGGMIKAGTMNWITGMMQKAKEQNATVLTMMHHNLVEHYYGQSYLDAGYTVDNWETTAKTLMDAGVNVIFTGHYHANDVTPYPYDGKVLYDIETGSLVTPPSPYRIVVMKNKNIEISTTHVKKIDATMPGGLKFTTYSDQFMAGHMDGYFHYMLTEKFGAPQEVADFAAPIYRKAFMAHIAGDEKMPPDQRTQIEQLTAIDGQLGGMATTLWTDLGLNDSKLVIPYR